jgi:hypothetical protein
LLREMRPLLECSTRVGRPEMFNQF